MANFLEQVKASTLNRIKNITLNQACFKNPIDFKGIFTKKYPIIAEIKFSSPSEGVIYHGGLNHIDIAEQYIDNNAAALSILTEPHYFNGHIQYIADIRERFPQVPILLKDFVLSELQILQALQYGANAVLLIASLLTKKKFKKLYHICMNVGLTPVVEVANIAELKESWSLNPEVILVNNRDLKNYSVDSHISSQLMTSKIGSVFMIAASGIQTSQTLKHIFDIGYDACLIGTALMKQDAPGIALKQLLREL